MDRDLTALATILLVRKRPDSLVTNAVAPLEPIL